MEPPTRVTAAVAILRVSGRGCARGSYCEGLGFEVVAEYYAAGPEGPGYLTVARVR